MKKWNLLLLTLCVLLLPATGLAQDLPDLLSAVYAGIGEGLEQGAMQAIAAMDQELTLEMTPSSARIEEGQTVCLTVTAGNPRPQAAKVRIELALPARLTAAQDLAWEAELPGAQPDAQTGELVPSVTTFTREIALVPGGESGQAEISAEMSMGTRFYKAKTPMELCVPDVSAEAEIVEAPSARIRPGDAFAYQVTLSNRGTAGKDVRVELRLPAGVQAAEPLPQGFAQEGNTLAGVVFAQAAENEPSVATLRFPMIVSDAVLKDDADALRLLSGSLRVDGERVALPRIEVCGAKISASLKPEKKSLETGETAMMNIVVVNSGLADADVRLSCVLPEGLTLFDGEATPGEAVTSPPQDGAALPETIAQPASATLEKRTLVFDLHMDAAKETGSGVVANTQVLEIPVMAGEPQDNLSEALLGATLAWTVDDEPAQLGDAVAMRVYRKAFLGISKDDWDGVFWAGLLLLAAVACLHAAARRDSKEEDFCCD